MCLGEMAVYAPISGGYIHFAERWVNPAVGFAVGWQVTVQYCISMPSEMIAANILCSYWDNGFPVSHQAAYITTFIVCGSLVVSYPLPAHTNCRTTSARGGSASPSSGEWRARHALTLGLRR